MSLSLITLALTLRNILLNDSSHRIHLHYTPPRMLCLALHAHAYLVRCCHPPTTQPRQHNIPKYPQVQYQDSSEMYRTIPHIALPAL